MNVFFKLLVHFLLASPPFFARSQSCTAYERLSIVAHTQFGLKKTLPQIPPIHAGYLLLLDNLPLRSKFSRGSTLIFEQRILNQTTKSK